MTDVPAQINFNIKLNMAREGQRHSANEGVYRAFNFNVKLEYAATSVGMFVSASINFYIKLKCAATSVNGVGGGSDDGSHVCRLFPPRRAPVLIW